MWIDVYTMKLFQVILKNAVWLGLRPRQRDENTSFNVQNLLVLLFFMLISISSAAFLWFDVTSFQEFAVTIYVWISATMTLIGFWIGVLNSVNLFRVIENLEKNIETRKQFILLNLQTKIELTHCTNI